MKFYSWLTSVYLLTSSTHAEKNFKEDINLLNLASDITQSKYPELFQNEKFAQLYENFMKMEKKIIKKNNGLDDSQREKLETLASENRAESETFGDEDFEGLEASAAGRSVNTGGSSANCAADPNCNVPMNLLGIWGYGCWCNFGNYLTNGKGQPVNALDAICERMQKCLRCAEFDEVAESSDDTECDVKNIEYNASFNQYINPKGLDTACAGRNEGNNCAIRVCTCELQLLNELLTLMWEGGYRYEAEYRHIGHPLGGTFDPKVSCKGGAGDGSNIGRADIDCCGQYPYRQPFYTTKRKCCKQNTFEEFYNPMEAECCADSVRKISDGGC